MEWIDVEDELPKQMCKVLIWHKNYPTDFILAFYDILCKEFIDLNEVRGRGFPLAPTHWIFMPEPPYHYLEVTKR